MNNNQDCKEEYKIIKIDGEDTDYQISKLDGWLIRNKKFPDKFLKVNRKTGRVHFIINGKRKRCTVKKLFSETFIPNPQHFKCVLFKDYNKQDVLTMDNLEWGTRSMAQKRSIATNTSRKKPQTGRSISMYKEKKEEEEPIIFESIRDAAKYILKNKEKLNLTFKTTNSENIRMYICNAIKNKKGFKYGFKFVYNDDIILTDEECKEQGIERKEVPGFSKYIAQTDGRVYYDRGKNSYYLKYYINNAENCIIHLMDDDNKMCNQRVNRIIGMTFLDEFEQSSSVSHKDGDLTNNNISNLFIK